MPRRSCTLEFTEQHSIVFPCDELRGILEAAAEQTIKVMAELKSQPLRDLISVDSGTGKLDLSRMDDDLQHLRGLQQRMVGITDILNTMDRGLAYQEEKDDDAGEG